MQTENYRKYFIIAMAIALVFLIAEVILFWNIIAHGKTSLSIFPFLCIIIVVLAMGYAFNTMLKATNQKILAEIINEKVIEERFRVTREFEKKEETELKTDNSEIIEDKIREIIPKGNFKNTDSLLSKYLKNLGNALEIAQGFLYIKDDSSDEYVFSSGYALTEEKNISSFKKGETLPGQVTLTGEIAFVNDIPENYFVVESGLGKSKPKHLVFVPVQSDNNVVGVLELALFKELNPTNKEILKKSTSELNSKITQTIKS
jgi:transcriptional regulator with GAF, ATPase, and Fis domain